jgi:hypothetical protein
MPVSLHVKHIQHVQTNKPEPSTHMLTSQKSTSHPCKTKCAANAICHKTAWSRMGEIQGWGVLIVIISALNVSTLGARPVAGRDVTVHPVAIGAKCCSAAVAEMHPARATHVQATRLFLHQHPTARAWAVFDVLGVVIALGFAPACLVVSAGHAQVCRYRLLIMLGAGWAGGRLADVAVPTRRVCFR